MSLFIFLELSQLNQDFHPRSVEVEYYLDLSCSACLDAWPTISRVTKTYSALGVKFSFRIFPLPYHQQAFILSKATAIVDFYSDSPDVVFSFMNTCYENQDKILNSATAGMSYNEVVELVGGWVVGKFARF